MQRRIVSSIWLLSGAAGFLFSAIAGVRYLRTGDPLFGSIVVSELVACGFCALAVVASLGLFRARLWALVLVSVLAALLALDCLAALLYFGGMADSFELDLGLAAFGAILGVYTLTVAWMFKPYTLAKA